MRIVVKTEVYASGVVSETASTISATTDSPRSHRTFISLNSASVNVFDRFGGMKLPESRKSGVLDMRRSTNKLVSSVKMGCFLGIREGSKRILKLCTGGFSQSDEGFRE